jgi:hypothetical protein
MRTGRNKKMLVTVAIGLGVLVMTTGWSVVAGNDDIWPPQPYESWPAEGMWVMTSPLLPGEVCTVHIIPEAGQPGVQSLVAEWINATGNLFGLFPDAEHSPPYVGTTIRTGENTYSFTMMSHLMKDAEPFDTITWISVPSGTFEMVGPDTFESSCVISLYSAIERPGHALGDLPDQDKDGDGFPDEGEEAVFCIPLTGVGKRVRLVPPDEPSPLPDFP